MGSNVLLEQMYTQLQEVAKKFDANTSVYRSKLYPMVADRFKTSSGKNAYKKCVSKFMATRQTALYDSLPCSRILFGEPDAQELFKAMEISKGEVTEIILQSYYGNEPNFSPKAAKDEFTILMLTIIRYFLENKMSKEAELAMLHLAFSGKFYPSLHYRSFPTVVPVRHVMEYTVNNVLGVKYDIVSEGSVIGSVRKIGTTWLTTYKDRFKSFSDEDVVYIINQLYSRIGSFMKNIATEYYKVYEQRDELYIAYATDSVEEDNYHLADSDSLRIAKIVEKTINYLTSMGAEYKLCHACSDVNITTNEMKSIMESLLNDPKSTVKIKELIMLMVSTYFAQTKDRDITNPRFITFTIAPKPNAKQPELIRINELVVELLSENSPAYLRRRSRIATKNSFERALKLYFALSVNNANRQLIDYQEHSLNSHKLEENIMTHDAAYLRFAIPRSNSDNMSMEEVAHCVSTTYRRGKLNYVTYDNIYLKTSGNDKRDQDFLSILERVDPIASSLVKIVKEFI